MPFYSFNLIATVVFALFFYRAGRSENSPALLWTALSVLISLLIGQWFKGGLLAILLGQIALLIGIAIFRGDHGKS